MKELTMQNTRIMRCLVVDDEPLAREGVIDLVKAVDFLTLVGSCASALETITFLNNTSIDLMFLDVNMPYLSGVDLLERLDNPPLTIVTTACSEYASDGFRLQLVDYLLKPISFKRFYLAVLKAQRAFNDEKALQNVGAKITQSPHNPFVYIKQSKDFLKITWDDILYIEGVGNYVKIIFADKQLIAHQTMISMEDVLRKDAFFRIHKSYIVNIHHIDCISGGRIFIGKHELPLSRHRKEELLQSVVYNNVIGR